MRFLVDRSTKGYGGVGTARTVMRNFPTLSPDETYRQVVAMLGLYGIFYGDRFTRRDMRKLSDAWRTILRDKGMSDACTPTR